MNKRDSCKLINVLSYTTLTYLYKSYCGFWLLQTIQETHPQRLIPTTSSVLHLSEFYRPSVDTQTRPYLFLHRLDRFLLLGSNVLFGKDGLFVAEFAQQVAPLDVCQLRLQVSPPHLGLPLEETACVSRARLQPPVPRTHARALLVMMSSSG